EPGEETEQNGERAPLQYSFPFHRSGERRSRNHVPFRLIFRAPHEQPDSHWYFAGHERAQPIRDVIALRRSQRNKDRDDIRHPREEHAQSNPPWDEAGAHRENAEWKEP